MLDVSGAVAFDWGNDGCDAGIGNRDPAGHVTGVGEVGDAVAVVVGGVVELVGIEGDVRSISARSREDASGGEPGGDDAVDPAHKVLNSSEQSDASVRERVLLARHL